VETTQLATKLFIPRVTPGLVVRSRLIQRLQGVLNNRFTLVSAPAGFGKTTLLSQWIQDSHVPTSWLSVEDAENDPVRFWDYFIGALQKISPSTGEKALSLLHSSPPIPIESTLNVLINDIITIPGDFVLVLDDYYLIHSEAVHHGLTYFIEHIPFAMHLVIVTRVDPPLPLARFRGKGSMLEIGTDDLRFNTDEASALLTSLIGQVLADEDLDAINARTEGWAVGLKMAALFLGKQKDISDSIAAFTGSQRYIMDYLVEEVLGYQSPDVRAFLLQTSVLARMCGPLCDAVIQGTSGHESLLNLEKANLFLIPLDESREWYRYHHLFAELLRHQLDLEYGKEMTCELHKKASRWYEDNNLFEEAIDHALSAKDWMKAIAVIRQPGVMSQKQRTSTLLNWLRRIPEEQLRAHEGIYFNYIWALMTDGQLAAAEDCLKYLDNIAGENSTLQGRIATARANIAVNTGVMTKAEEYAVKAHALLPPDDATQVWTQDRSEHAVVGLILGAVLMMQERHLEAEKILQSSLEFLQKTGASSATINPLYMLSMIAFNKGELHRAAQLCKDAVEAVKGHPATAEAHLLFGNVYYEWNDLESALSHYEQAAEMLVLRKGSSVVGYDNACYRLALTRMAMGDINGANKAMEDADKLLSDETAMTPRNRIYNTAYHAAIALINRDKQSALRWAENLIQSGTHAADFPVSIIRLIYAQRSKDVEDKEFQAAYERFKTQGLRYIMAVVRIVQALDSLGPGNPLDYLTEALTLVKPEGFLRTFVDFGMELAPLLKQAIAKGIEPEYARKLLTIIEAEDRQRKIRKGELPSSSMSSSILSDREMEVLHLMASGLSDRQIATKLVISLSTAKTHVHHIIEKLNVNNRTQAVTQAKELRLS
jgi:LuxR family transcriptional regulator, maltose regulon positive regulatory protein